MTELEKIQHRINDCKTYNFGMYSADKLAHEDSQKMLNALTAILSRSHADWCCFMGCPGLGNASCGVNSYRMVCDGTKCTCDVYYAIYQIEEAFGIPHQEFRYIEK